MPEPADTMYRRVAQLCGAGAALVGFLALLGWFGGWEALTRVRSAYIPMAPNTGLLFLILGGSLFLFGRPANWNIPLTRLGTGLLIGVSGLRLTEFIFGFDLSLDFWVFKFPAERLGLAPVGRMAFFTAVNFLFAGISLLLLTRPSRMRVSDWAAAGLAAGVFFIGVTFVLGYLYRAPLFYEGATIPMAFNTAIAFVLSGGGLVLFTVEREVRDRRRAKEALRKSEEKFRTLFDSLDTGICTIEVLFDGNDKPVDYRFLEINPSFEKQTGIQNAVGRNMREIAPLHEEHWFEIYGKIALTGEPLRFENEAAQLSRWYDVYAFRVGEPERRQVAIHFNDITERKRVEREIEKLNESLRQQAAQLEAANKELEAFSYSVSHDLRAPLRSIDGFSQAVLEDSSEKLDEQGKDYLGRVRAACQRMAQLIDDLLNLSRVSRGEMRLETVDLSGMAREIVSELQRQAPERKVSFRIADNLTGRGDPRLLRVALENLLGNAWKYTSKHPKATIEFGARREPDGKAAFFVHDDGAGFDMAYAGKLFGAFQRLHGPAEFAGTGVGLATVQRIVHRHGGRVWAEGSVEQGATFYFTL